VTKAAAPPPRHLTPRSSMKLVLSAVLSFGIVGKCLLKAVWGERKSQNLTEPQAFHLVKAVSELQHMPAQAAAK